MPVALPNSPGVAYNLIETTRRDILHKLPEFLRHPLSFSSQQDSLIEIWFAMSTDVSSGPEPLGTVETALTPQQRFEEYLQSRGMRITQQRRLLVDHVFSRHEHFDADALIEQLPSSGQPGHVSRPTVYRTLNEFVDAGLLRRFVLNGRAVYEHDYGYPQHDHMHCVECNKLYEFQSPELMELRDRVAREHRFRVTGHRLIISGVCQGCAQKKRKASHRMNMI